ncbi:hypothetical protein MSAN_02039400 [Mycena sanguinolenta]|uniref:Uncharacterized protein n=1 Tax=Mycena sanguinolenta TaxID=230812 RepID=A0A8H6XK15_9AGAR|nr:hypothetical protein MSAN_02039400 [Mycena sanguinolenta]
MHPSLKLSNLDRLPDELRVRAKAAAGGSAEERAHFAMRFVPHLPPDVPLESLPFLLPVFCAILDLSLLDTVSNQLDSPIMTGDAHLRTVGIFCTLRAILALMEHHAIPSAALGDLWTLIWPWMELLDRHHDTVRTLHFLPDVYMHTIFIPLIIGILHKHPQASQSMHATPRLCGVIGKGWVQMLRAANFTKPELGGIYHFLGIWFSETECSPAAFDELVIGVGGTHRDLVALIFELMSRFLPTPDAPLTAETISCLGALFRVRWLYYWNLRGIESGISRYPSIVQHHHRAYICFMGVGLQRPSGRRKCADNGFPCPSGLLVLISIP